MKKLNFHVIFVDTIPARIYLTLLIKSGIVPESVIRLNQPLPSRACRALSKIIGKRLSIVLYKQLVRRKSIVSPMLSESLLGKFGLNENDLSDESIFPDYLNVSSLDVDHINDPVLVNFLYSLKTKNFLFTGGGLLKEEMLGIPGARFIHVHPGIVPEIKGADCFFWSYLLRGKLGYSIFFMNEGIDTGDILFLKEYELDLKGINLSEYNNDSVYHGILTYYDPALRVSALIELLEQNQKKKGEQFRIEDMKFSLQKPTDGRTFFFMHSHFKDLVISKIKRAETLS